MPIEKMGREDVLELVSVGLAPEDINFPRQGHTLPATFEYNGSHPRIEMSLFEMGSPRY